MLYYLEATKVTRISVKEKRTITKIHILTNNFLLFNINIDTKPSFLFYLLLQKLTGNKHSY